MLWSIAPEMPTAPAKVHALLAEAVKKAEAAGNTVLFTGAEEYLPYLAGIFQDLGGKRIAVAVKDAIWKERLHYVFPRGRAMLESELAEDTEHYDYIFDFETDGIAAAADLRHRLAEKGVMDVIIPSALLTKEGDAALAARRSLVAEKKLTAFYECLSRSDLKQARKMIDEIKNILGEDDPEVVGAETSLDLEAMV